MLLKNLINRESPLALVMCVKNEEKGLLTALKSVAGLVSEIVIAVDDESTDKTEKLAKINATTIKYFTFRDNFSEIRNFAQEGVKAPWVLILDGHEYVSNPGKLLNALKTNADGLMCTIEMENGSRFRNPRIIRNQVKYVGRVHEQQLCTKIEPFFEFIIKHDRLNNQTEEGAEIRKKQRDLHTTEALKADFKEDNNNINALFHLILHYQSTLNTYRSKKLIKKYLNLSHDKQFIWFLFYNQSLAYLTKRKYGRSFYSACQANLVMPNRWEIKKIQGLIFIETKKWEKAIGYLVKSLEANKFPCYFEPLAQKVDSTWNIIGEALFNQKDYLTAHIAFKRASELASEPIFKELTTKRSECMKNIADNLSKNI